MTQHTRVPRHQLPPRAQIHGATWTANGYVFKTVRVTEEYVCARVVRQIRTSNT